MRVKEDAHGLAWRSFQACKDLLARLGFKKLPGAERLYIFMKRRLRPPGTVLLESHGNLMYADSKDEGVLPLLQAGGIYEEFETALFKSLLEPGMVVADIGANIGHYSLIAARMVGDSGHVYSFEPDPHNYELLVRNIELNGFKNVTAINKAVSGEPGTLTLFLDKYNLGGHSLARDNVLIDAGRVQVETVTLDSYFTHESGRGRVDVMKVDTQGAEGFIVEGGRRLLEENEVSVLMELWPFGLRNAGYDPDNLVVNLERLGFGFKLIDSDAGEARAMEAAEVVELCDSLRASDQFVDLFLQKS